MQGSRKLLSLILGGGIFILGLVPLFAAESSPTTTGAPPEAERVTRTNATETTVLDIQTPTPEGIQAAITELESNDKLEADARQELVDQYKSALELLTSAERNKKNAEAFKRAIDEAPEETTRLRAELVEAEAVEPKEGELPPGLTAESTLEELRQLLTKEQAALSGLKSELAKLKGDIESRRKRPAEAARQIEDAEKKLAEADRGLEAEPPGGEPPMSDRARRVLLTARRTEARTEANMIEQERLSQQILLELLTARRDLTVRKVTAGDAREQALRALVDEKNAAEARAGERAAEQAQREARFEHPLIQSLAATNAVFAAQLTQVIALSTNISSQLGSIEAKRKQLAVAYTNASRQIEAAGLSEFLAQYLLNARRDLPDVRELKEQQASNKTTISTNALQRVRVEALLEGLLIVSQRVKVFLSDTNRVDANLPESARSELEKGVNELLRTRREILTRLDTQYGKLMEELRQLDENQTDYVKLVIEYSGFLDERLMWTPSSPPIGTATVAEIVEALQWYAAPEHRAELGVSLKRLARKRTFLCLALLVALVGLLAVYRRLIHVLADLADEVKSISSDSFSLTLRALAITLVLVLPFALPPLFVGWQLGLDPTNGGFPRSVGHGLLEAGADIFALLLIVQLCRPRGVAEVHFRWEQRTLSPLRKHLAWLLPVVVLVDFTTSTLLWQQLELHQGSLGRTAYILGMMALAVFAQRLLRPRHGVLSATLESRPNGWLARSFWLWYPLMVAAPLALAVLAAVGYYYTALRLELRLMHSLWLLGTVTLLYQIALRWLFVRARKLAWQQVQQRRQSEAEAARKEEVDGSAELVQVDEQEVSLASINQQTRKFLRVFLGFSIVIGLWLIWAHELPALNYLQNFGLWSTSQEIEGVMKLVPVTVADVLTSLILFVLTIAASRNLPGLLEILILQKLPLQSGSRYAISAISQYALVAIGVALAFGKLGVNWSQLGWIAAALSVGLGFGLQEVVANFVCGILIFFERPIRVGDIVTVSDVTGVVSKIQIRATTITDWDRKEFIVPNKEFITGRILNWTLTNTINRIVIQVGVAYGSDTQQARDLLLEVAKGHPLTLDDPPPMAHFDGFHDSSLNLTLRCYLPNLDNRLNTTHELHTLIDAKFKEAGLEIAFPQRDIHIRSIEPVLHVNRGSESSGSPKPPESPTKSAG